MEAKTTCNHSLFDLKARGMPPLVVPPPILEPWDLSGRQFRPKSIRTVRASAIPRLLTAIMEILTAMKWMRGSIEFRVNHAASSYWHYRARDLMEAMGLINVTRGYYRGPGDYKRSILSPSQGLLRSLESWTTAPAQPAPVIHQRHVPHLLTEINEFLAEHTYEGCAIPVLKRVMYTKKRCRHGRLYSLGFNNYQHLSDRTNIRIDGKETVEIDISASHLTGFLGASAATRGTLTEPMVTSDLYSIPGIPRKVVKAALMLILGKGTLLGLSWYQLKDGESDHLIQVCRKYAIQEVVARLLERYPQLRSVTPQTASDLFYRESQAILGTIQELMAKGIPSLPTHDSILVTSDAVETASEVLSRNYYESFGVKPLLKTKVRQDTGCEETRDLGSIEALIDKILFRVTKSSGCVGTDRHTGGVLIENKDSNTNTMRTHTNNHLYSRLPDPNQHTLHPVPINTPRGHRPLAASPTQVAEIRRLHAQGMGQRTIAKTLGLGHQTVRTVCRSFQVTSDPVIPDQFSRVDQVAQVTQVDQVAPGAPVLQDAQTQVLHVLQDDDTDWETLFHESASSRSVNEYDPVGKYLRSLRKTERASGKSR